MCSIKCSIVTTSYNSVETIEKTILSVLNQTYKNIEYIVVDAGSTDGTVEVIEAYMEKFDGRMKWISEPDDGIYYGMNKGLQMCSGELVGILNSDDTYEPNAVEKMCQSMGDEKYQVLYGMVRYMERGEMKSVGLISHTQLPKEMIGHPGCFVTRNVYSDIATFDTQYTSVADYDFMFKLYNDSRVVFKPIYELVANFEIGGMSSTDKAYLDLLKFRMNNGQISHFNYKWHCFLQKLIDAKRQIIK